MNRYFSGVIARDHVPDVARSLSFGQRRVYYGVLKVKVK
jgi:hypothetical protein